jgi:hypothetical protein
MNIAALKGEKTVKTLAKRLLAEPTKDTPKTTQAEMEAALLRLNPQLGQIGDLKKGTPIVVPDQFALAPDESATPTHALADELLRQAESALASLRGVIKERTDQFTVQTEQVQTWLKSQQARELVKESPELKAVFSDAARAAKVLPKEQAAVVKAETKSLDKVEAEVKTFRITNLRANASVTGAASTLVPSRITG